MASGEEHHGSIAGHHEAAGFEEFLLRQPLVGAGRRAAHRAEVGQGYGFYDCSGVQEEKIKGTL